MKALTSLLDRLPIVADPTGKSVKFGSHCSAHRRQFVFDARRNLGEVMACYEASRAAGRAISYSRFPDNLLMQTAILGRLAA